MLAVARASDTLGGRKSFSGRFPIKRGTVAKKTKSQQIELIEEIESITERAANWVRDHLYLTVGVLVAVLASVGAVGAMQSHQIRQAEAAADALDQVTADYMVAMGANPGDLVAPEPANPTAANSIRNDFAAQYAAVAAEHAGTPAAAMARFEEGNLAAESGDLDHATQIWEGALGELSENPSLRGIFQQRIGGANEAAGRWLQAGEAHEAASAIEGYPLRYWAMASAARCYDQADEHKRARDLSLRLSQLAPDLKLPDHLNSLFEGLRVSHNP
jgi:tetratricopeptide (TPR) repeat protein